MLRYTYTYISCLEDSSVLECQAARLGLPEIQIQQHHRENLWSLISHLAQTWRQNFFCREYFNSKLRICCRYFWKGLYLLQCAFRWVPEPCSPAIICFHENVNRIWANEYLKKSPPFRTTHCKYCRSCVGRKPLFTDLTAVDSVTCLSPVWEKDSKFFSHPGVLCCKKLVFTKCGPGSFNNIQENAVHNALRRLRSTGH